jgi:hypothetical protein
MDRQRQNIKAALRGGFSFGTKSFEDEAICDRIARLGGLFRLWGVTSPSSGPASASDFIKPSLNVRSIGGYP